MMRLFTIGFTRKSAEQFFTKLETSGVRRIVDVRLNNVSQLAGFSKRDDLRFFLQRLLGVAYVHVPELAPTQDMLDELKKQGGPWSTYEARFNELLAQRRVQTSMEQELRDGDCLLCSEDTPEHCHRRLVVEYLGRHWPDLQVTHIL